jgi:hypothetical protein
MRQKRKLTLSIPAEGMQERPSLRLTALSYYSGLWGKEGENENIIKTPVSYSDFDRHSVAEKCMRAPVCSPPP